MLSIVFRFCLSVLHKISATLSVSTAATVACCLWFVLRFKAWNDKTFSSWRHLIRNWSSSVISQGRGLSTCSRSIGIRNLLSSEVVKMTFHHFMSTGVTGKSLHSQFHQVLFLIAKIQFVNSNPFHVASPAASYGLPFDSIHTLQIRLFPILRSIYQKKIPKLHSSVWFV